MIDNIKEELELLSRHPVLNLRKINKDKKEIKKLTLEKDEDQSIQINNISDSINIIKDKIEIAKTRKEQLNKEKQTIIVKVNNYFKCDSINKIDYMVDKSKEVNKTYDILNSITLDCINTKLNKMGKEILDDEIEVKKINENKITIK